MNITLLSQKVIGLTKQVQDILSLGKRIEEFPAQDTVNPESKLIVSTNGETESLEVGKLLVAVSNETQNNKVVEFLLGTITEENTLENILDNTGIAVASDEIAILSVFQAIDNGSEIEQFMQRLFLWKLGKGNFSPIGSENIDSKLFELPSIYPTEETADDITEAPDAIVYELGTVSDILTAINTKNPALSYEDDSYIYYVRATISGVKYLYQFRGVNGIYGDGNLQMVNEDLVLIYSSASTGAINDSAYVKKEYYSEISFSLTGDIDAYEIGAQFGHYVFKSTGSMTSLSSLNLASTSLNLFIGKPLILENQQSTPIPIKRNFGTGLQKFLVSYASDYILQPGEKILLYFTRQFLTTGSFEFMMSNRAANISYVDAQNAATLAASRTTPQFNITGNMPLTNAHNGGILKIKATCTITVPSGLASEFSCVARTFSGATATFVEGSGVSFDAQKGKIQDPFRMSTIFKDGSTSSYILEGELRT